MQKSTEINVVPSGGGYGYSVNNNVHMTNYMKLAAAMVNNFAED
jgi:hypothetical protein